MPATERGIRPMPLREAVAQARAATGRAPKAAPVLARAAW